MTVYGFSCFEALINQTRQQTKYCLGLASQSSKKGSGNNHYNTGLDEEETIDKMRKEIESSQENALSLCTEKVLLARQAYDLVSSITSSKSSFRCNYDLFSPKNTIMYVRSLLSWNENWVDIRIRISKMVNIVIEIWI